MAAYLIAIVRAHDLSWVDKYNASVPAIVGKHGGEYIAVSGLIKRYEGIDRDPDGIVLFRFPSMDAIDAFVTDPEYAPYKAARLASSSGDLFAFTPRD